MKLVFVYLGDRIPDYAYKNVLSTAVKFPNHSVTLITDKHLTKPKDLGNLEFFNCSNPSLTWNAVKKNFSYDETFRNDFWFKALARFQALGEYMKVYTNDSILHIESDVWLSSRFPMELIERIRQSIAYPLTNWDEGVASTLFLKNYDSIRFLLNFCEAQVAQNPLSTDVTILGSLHQAHPSKVLVLPTSPVPTTIFNTHVNQATKEKMSENFNHFSGLFDASTWGQFLFGHDARNRLGWSPIYKHQDHHSISTRELEFSLMPPDHLNVKVDGQVFPIFSLHIHSKVDTVFDTNLEFSALHSTVKNVRFGETYRFNIRYFLMGLPSYLTHKFKRFLKRLILHG